MGRTGVVAGVVALVLAGQAHANPSTVASKEPAAPRSYRVTRGDTLSRVAARLEVSVADLVTTNMLVHPNRIRAGQVLTVPASRPSAKPPPTPTGSTKAPALDSRKVVLGAGDQSHQVAPGETLGAIARRYAIALPQLVEHNGLADPDRIVAGTALRVPGAPWLCPVQGDRSFADTWGAPRSGGRRHLGADVFAPRGTPVVASVGGTLTHAPGNLAGLAYYLRGDDGHTYYGAHLDELGAAGRIERGGAIGTVGSTGNARGTPAHLHFEIKPDGGTSVNPFFTLERWC